MKSIFLILILSAKLVCANYKLGLENIDQYLDILKNKRIGLVTNHTGVATAIPPLILPCPPKPSAKAGSVVADEVEGRSPHQGEVGQVKLRNIDILLSKNLKISTIYTPEHGLDGKTEASANVANSIDNKTQIPIVSLYNNKRPLSKFTADDFKAIDIFVFDMQDSGMRHYTYISTMYRIMQTALKYNKSVVILDRPNPLGPIMEGPIVEPPHISFVGVTPIPLRHGLTVGELALYFNKYCLATPINLIIIPMTNYKRTDTLQMLTALSPNITNLDSCYGYSFLGILDTIDPFDVALNTAAAFQYIGIKKELASKVNWETLTQILEKQNIWVIFENSKPNIHEFISKKNNLSYVGIKIKIADITKVKSFSTLLDILYFFTSLDIKFSYAPIFNLLTGTTKFRDLFEKNSSLQDFLEQVNQEIKQFYIQVKDLLLYEPKIFN